MIGAGAAQERSDSTSQACLNKVHIITVDGLNNRVKTFIRPVNRVLHDIDSYIKMFN